MRLFRVHCAVLNARTGTPGLSRSQRYGGHGERETPGPIPNPEAKPLSADGTAPETGWESRTPPNNTSMKGPHHPVRALHASLKRGIGARRRQSRGDTASGPGFVMTDPGPD